MITQNKLAISFEVNQIVKVASLVPRLTPIDMWARVGGIAALLTLIGFFAVVPVIKHWRDQEIYKNLYKVAPPLFNGGNQTEDPESDLAMGREFVLDKGLDNL